MALSERGVREFARALASPAPTPGGGGASALAAALGAALGGMVGALSAGKQRTEEDEAALRALTERAAALRERLLDCIDRDAEAFEPLSRAYRLPKDDPARAAVMEKALRAAAEPPLEILALTVECTELLRDFAVLGSAMVRSDAATGAALCEGALRGAAINVRANTRLMRERSYAGALDARAEELLGRGVTLARQVYENGYRRDG